MMIEADLGQDPKSGSRRESERSPTAARDRAQSDAMRFHRIGIPAVAAAVAQMKAMPAAGAQAEEDPAVPHEADAN